LIRPKTLQDFSHALLLCLAFNGDRRERKSYLTSFVNIMTTPAASTGVLPLNPVRINVLLKHLADLENGQKIRLLPFGIQHENATQCIIGNGVIIDPEVLLKDLDALGNNGINASKKLHISDRCHFITELHNKICLKLKDIRQDKIWLDQQDICSSFKPARLGLRVCHLTLGSW